MDDKLEREILTQLKRLVKAQERIAAALEAANATDPLAMIHEALEAEERATGHPVDPSTPLDDETELMNIRAYVAALR